LVWHRIYSTLAIVTLALPTCTSGEASLPTLKYTDRYRLACCDSPSCAAPGQAGGQASGQRGIL